MIDVLLMFLPFIVIAIIANLGEKSKVERELTYVLLAGFCGSIAVIGILLVVIDIIFYISEPGMDIIIIGIGRFLTGISGLILLIRDLRKIIAEYIPIKPDSVMHATGLVFAVVVIGLSFTMMFSTDILIMYADFPEELQMTQMDIIAQDSLFIIIALIGIGLFIRRNPKECIERLKLTNTSAKFILIGIIAIPLFLAFTTAFEYAVFYFYPESMTDIEKIMELLLGNMTLLLALTASIGAGVSEEILFRGAIQPRFGILFTAFLFAVVHIQYSSLLAITELLIVGILLGYLKRATNTTTCIITHTGYDFVVFLSFVYYF